MIDGTSIPAGSALLDDATKAMLQNVFGKLTKDVVLKAVVDLEEEKSAEMASFLKGIAALGSHITKELISFPPGTPWNAAR